MEASISACEGARRAGRGGACAGNLKKWEHSAGGLGDRGKLFCRYKLCVCIQCGALYDVLCPGAESASDSEKDVSPATSKKIA